MKASERQELWEALSTVEDWLGGARRQRDLPDFEALEAASAAKASAVGSQDSLDFLRQEVLSCQACRLCQTRKTAVPGQGVADPLVMIVGEGPGAEEDATGLPFVGPAGKLLDRMLASIGLSRDRNCFIANVVKCRPPQNRDPAGDEVEACLPYLKRQINLLKPKAILCVGRVAASALLSTGEGVGRLRGGWRQFQGLPLLVTYHPSALLRDEALKRPAWEDLKLFRTRLLELGAFPESQGSPDARP